MTNPKLPPILINKAGSVYYVYTYKNVWDRELKRSKRGESKKIGTILGGQKDGKIRFDETFIQDHPEFRNYQVERRGKDYVFTQISEEGLVIVNRRVDEYLKYKGFRVLVSDSEKDPVKAWTAYADRWRVEDAFGTLKDRLGCNRIRCSDNKALQGKTFVQFIATGLSLMVRSRIRCYMKENKKAGKLNLVYESDAKILQVLNNVMQTRFNHGYYFDEVAGKKIKYFEALGVGVPGAGPETPEDVQEEPEAETLLGTDIEI